VCRDSGAIFASAATDATAGAPANRSSSSTDANARLAPPPRSWSSKRRLCSSSHAEYSIVRLASRLPNQRRRLRHNSIVITSSTPTPLSSERRVSSSRSPDTLHAAARESPRMRGGSSDTASGSAAARAAVAPAPAQISAPRRTCASGLERGNGVSGGWS